MPSSRVIAFGSDEYFESVALRNLVLREPLGLRLTPEELSRDDQDLHLAIFDGVQLIASLILMRLNANRVKIRQVAVHPHFQSKGIGSELVRIAEAKVRELGASEIELSARMTALQFYLKHGYVTEGAEYLSTSLPHKKMTKKLSILE